MDKQEQAFEAQYRAALEVGKKAEETEPRAVSAKYDVKTKRMVVNLRSGVTFLFPIQLIEGLEDATGRELSDVEILGNGAALHWESLDVDLSVPQLLMGVFGTKAWMSHIRSEIGKLGGSQKSPAKAKASRKNGTLGGRPAKAA